MNLSACFLPILEANTNSIYWDKRASVVYSIGINVDYWQQSTYLSRINGVAYKMYLRWIEKYVSKNRVFTPQSICSSEDKMSCFTKAETWETFLSDRFNFHGHFLVMVVYWCSHNYNSVICWFRICFYDFFWFYAHMYNIGAEKTLWVGYNWYFFYIL